MITCRSVRCLVLMALVSVLLSSSASAESARLDGYVTGTQEVALSTTLADGHVAKRITMSLTVVTDDQANPFNLASQDCVATYIYDRDDKPIGGKGFCDGISVDGHVWWLSIELRPDGIVNWKTLGGVGKFSTLQGSGTTTVLAELPDGKVIGRFEGTYSN